MNPLDSVSPLVSVSVRLLFWVSVMCLGAALVMVGPRKLAELRTTALPRLRELKVPLLALIAVLVASALGRGALQTVSELFGLHLTGLIFAIEGEFVAWLQATFQSESLTVYFSWVYIYGYVFMLTFPFILYGVLEETTTLKRLITAYALNYAIGLAFYTLILAHGPRNVMPDLVTSLLYTFNPDFQALTSEVNENTNVFPSLHTSLSATVMGFALLTRERYLAWAVIASWLAVSVWISTMYLGIHWLVDVFGGIGLAAGCIFLSYRFVSPSVGEIEEDTATVLDD